MCYRGHTKNNKNWKSTGKLWVVTFTHYSSKAKMQACLNFMLGGTNWLLVVAGITKFLRVLAPQNQPGELQWRGYIPLRRVDCQGPPSHLYSLRKVSVHSELRHQIIFTVDLSTTPLSLFVWYNCRTNVENSNIIFRLSKPLWTTLQWKKVPSLPTCYSFHYWPCWKRVRALNQITKPVPTHRVWAAGQCPWLNKARRRGVVVGASLSGWQLGALR